MEERAVDDKTATATSSARESPFWVGLVAAGGQPQNATQSDVSEVGHQNDDLIGQDIVVLECDFTFAIDFSLGRRLGSLVGGPKSTPKRRPTRRGGSQFWVLRLQFLLCAVRGFNPKTGDHHRSGGHRCKCL